MSDFVSAESIPISIGFILFGIVFFLAPSFGGKIPIFGDIDWTTPNVRLARQVALACVVVGLGIFIIQTLDGDDEVESSTSDEAITSTSQPDSDSQTDERSLCDAKATADQAEAVIADNG